MQYNMEGILRDLVYIDNIASDVNGKRQLELVNIEERYKAEIEKLDKQLEEEKTVVKKYVENAAAEAQKEAGIIEENKSASIRALENRFLKIKKEILSQAIYELFGMEMDRTWIP